MVVTKYTFFSPNGNNFPVTSNADGKLYMMLTSMNYGDLRVKHWTNPINTALNRVYVNTSFVVGGRYFELTDHSVTLQPAVTNYVHAVIDLSNTLDPVTVTVEQSNTSNTTDINSGSGVLKVCFDIITTSGSAVMNASMSDRIYNLGFIKAADIQVTSESGNFLVGNGISCSWQRKGEIVSIRWSGNLTAITNGSAFASKAPVQIRPNGTKELIGHFANGTSAFHIDLEQDGTFRWWGGNNTGAARGTAMYFLK